MRSRPTARGLALPAALGLVLVVALVSAGLAAMARTELRLAWHRQILSARLSAADACLAQVVAALPAGWDFSRALAGSDGLAGTADDGVLAAPAGCTASALPAPGAVAPPRRLLELTAQGPPGQRHVRALVGWAATPGVGVLLWAAAPDRMGSVTGLLDLDGHDASDPGARPLAALGGPTDPSDLDDWIGAAAGLVRTSPGTEAPVATPEPPLAALVTRARATAPTGVLVPSGPVPVSITLANGDLTIGGPLLGAGLLVVDGVLDVQAMLDFAGVIVATQGLRVTPGATLTLRGEAWLGAPATGPTLTVAGTVRIEQDHAAVSAADALLALPRRAVPAGLVDGG
ncbi:MAG: hypothetical protein U0807_08870 [Candidatus Binatia bacterium]